MRRRLAFVTAATMALALVGIATASHGGAQSKGACQQLAALRSVFPAPQTVSFRARAAIRRSGIREPLRKWKCGGWWTTYTGYRGTGAFTDVSVTLFKSRGAARAGLAEPIAGPDQLLPNGVRVRTRVKKLALDSGVTSLVGNVRVTSTGSGPDDVYSGAESVRAQMRIHRRIHAAVLGLR